MPTFLGYKNKSTTGTREVAKDALYPTRKTFRDVVYVKADSINDTEDDIMATSGVPLLGSFTNGAWLRRKTPKEVDSAALLWEVTLEYDSEYSPEDRGRTVDWYWGAENLEITLTKDVITGLPIVNSANEPIIITTNIPIPVLTVRRLETSFDPNTILLYMNRTNSVPFYGAPQDTALLADIRDEPAEYDGQLVRQVTYVIKFNLLWDEENQNYLGWTSNPLNIGTRYFETANDDSTVKIYFKDGVQTTTFLNLDGTARDESLSPIYLQFYKHLRTNLNSLNLGPF